jgi:hypothetical protein
VPERNRFYNLESIKIRIKERDQVIYQRRNEIMTQSGQKNTTHKHTDFSYSSKLNFNCKVKIYFSPQRNSFSCV